VLPATIRDQFINLLVETGNVSRTALRLGINRMTAYAWREDPYFDERWEAALEIARLSLKERVVETACMMGVGEWVPVVDPVTGETELDDGFEPVMQLQTSHVDARVLMKLMDKTMRDEVRTFDQRTLIARQVDHRHQHVEVVLFDASGKRLDMENMSPKLELAEITHSDVEDVEDGERAESEE